MMVGMKLINLRGEANNKQKDQRHHQKIVKRSRKNLRLRFFLMMKTKLVSG